MVIGQRFFCSPLMLDWLLPTFFPSQPPMGLALQIDIHVEPYSDKAKPFIFQELDITHKSISPNTSQNP
jgi:hypothetical protein